MTNLNILDPIHSNWCFFAIDSVCKSKLLKRTVFYSSMLLRGHIREKVTFPIGYYLYTIINGAVIARNTTVSKCKLWSDSSIILSKSEKCQEDNPSQKDKADYIYIYKIYTHIYVYIDGIMLPFKASLSHTFVSVLPWYFILPALC